MLQSIPTTMTLSTESILNRSMALEQEGYALIDADLLLHEASSTVDESRKGALSSAIDIFNDKIQTILTDTNSRDFTLYITSDGKRTAINIRKYLFKKYKANRKREDIKNLKTFEALRNWVLHSSNYRGHVVLASDNLIYVSGNPCHLETDDLLLMDYEWNTRSMYSMLWLRPVICSRDKDFLQHSGYHYHWGMGKRGARFHYVNFYAAVRNYGMQLLTGDRSDNIPGLLGIGPIKASQLIQMFCQQRRHVCPQRMVTWINGIYRAYRSHGIEEINRVLKDFRANEYVNIHGDGLFINNRYEIIEDELQDTIAQVRIPFQIPYWVTLKARADLPTRYCPIRSLVGYNTSYNLGDIG